MSNEIPPRGKKIVFYDGTCAFCLQSVQLIIRYDKRELFCFAPSAGELAKKFNLPNVDSLILVEGEKTLFYAKAALRICKNLDWPLKMLYPLYYLPNFIIDPFYRLIAKYREAIKCEIPKDLPKGRFLE